MGCAEHPRAPPECNAGGCEEFSRRNVILEKVIDFEVVYWYSDMMDSSEVVVTWSNMW